MAVGTTLVQYECASSILQKFWLTSANGGFFAIRSAWTGLCMHAATDSASAGANIVQGSCLDQASRQWSLVVREGGVSLVRADSGLALDVIGAADVADGVALQQSVYDGSPDMIWQLEPTSGGTVSLQPYERSGEHLSVATRAVEVVAGRESRWKLFPGLADANCVSFELATAPASYLRHSNFLLWVDANNGTTFAADATFCLRDGLAATGADLRSFESQNFTGHFITLPGEGQAALESLVDSDDFRAHATWVVEGN